MPNETVGWGQERPNGTGVRASVDNVRNGEEMTKFTS